jgi:hypothetical protein
MTRYLPLVLVALFFVVGRPAPALASPIVWTIEDARFDDGGTLSGHFLATYEASTTGATHDFRLRVDGGSTPLLPAARYDQTTDSLFVWTESTLPASEERLEFCDYASGGPNHTDFGDRYLVLELGGPLTDAGGIVTFDLSTSFEASYASTPITRRYLVSGHAVGVPLVVPEPGMLALVGIAAIYAHRRYRRRA